MLTIHVKLYNNTEQCLQAVLLSINIPIFKVRDFARILLLFHSASVAMWISIKFLHAFSVFLQRAP